MCYSRKLIVLGFITGSDCCELIYVDGAKNESKFYFIIVFAHGIQLLLSLLNCPCNFAKYQLPVYLQSVSLICLSLLMSTPLCLGPCPSVSLGTEQC